MTLIIKFNSLVAVLFFAVLVKTGRCNTECNLAKIFRTPKDFDHLEIVERVGFDHTESTTLCPPLNEPLKKSFKKNGNNYAKAQVSLSFGPDYGHNHIMKIPPPCRHIISNRMNHLPDVVPNQNFFIPPSSHTIPPVCPHHQYYHPYPPPVPYAFPNYYFWSPREELALLPPQLNEYFRRHPDFAVANYPYNKEVFIGDGPVEIGGVQKTADFVETHEPSLKVTEYLDVLPNNLPPSSLQDIRTRIFRSLDSTNETNKEKYQQVKKMKKDYTSQNENKEADNNVYMEYAHPAEISPYPTYNKETVDNGKPKVPEQYTDDVIKQMNDLSKLLTSELNTQEVEKQIDSPTKAEIPESPTDAEQEFRKQPNDLGAINISDQSTKTFRNELEKLLFQALVEYENCGGPSKMLVSYPVINRDNLLTDLKPIIKATSCPPSVSSQKEKFADNNDNLGLIQMKNIKNGNNTTNMPPGKRFFKDIDDLVSVLIEISDRGKSSALTQLSKITDDASLFPELIIPPAIKSFVPGYSSLYPNFMLPFNPLFPAPPPLSALIDLALGNYGGNAYKKFLDTQMASISSAKSKTNDAQTERLKSSGDSSPKIKPVNENDRTPIAEPKNPNRKYEIPETSLPTQIESVVQGSPLPTYEKVIPVTEKAKPLNDATLSNYESGQNEDYLKATPVMVEANPLNAAILSSYVGRQNLDYLSRLPTAEPTLQPSPEGNVLLKEGNSPKYLQDIPSSDLQLVTPKENLVPAETSYSNNPGNSPPSRSYCSKCGHKHSGGNYCDYCGYPLFYQNAMGS